MTKWLNNQTKKTLFALVLTAIINVLLKSPIYAADFTIDQKINYNCSKEEKCEVEINITLTNNTKDYYVSNYKITLGLKDISNVSSTIKETALLTEIHQEGEFKTILVKFDKPILGEGSQATFTVNFDTNDVIKKVGRIYEVSIPKVNKSEELRNTSINIFIPSFYGPLMYVSPKPNSVIKSDQVEYSFTNNQVYSDGISIVLGDFQLFNFEIFYELKNDSVVLSKEFSIPFPPDVEKQQKIYLTKLSEYPESFSVDDNGNYIAKYTLKPDSQLNIKLYGLVKVFNREININNGGLISNIPKEMIQKYTKPQRYWETKASSIANIASSLKDENLKVSENANKAYSYVIETLRYSKERQSRKYLERFGASKAMENPDNAVCMEFTDLLIAILRAMEIPAREINGYAYSEDLAKKPLSVFYSDNKDLLHSWVEYYDPSLGWVQVDPTWGQSSGLDYFSNLGTNHIVFVRKEMPNYPLPPGSYKSTQDQQKSVIITFGNENLLSEDIKPLSSLLTQKDKNIEYKITYGILLVLALCMIFLVARDLSKGPRR